MELKPLNISWSNVRVSPLDSLIIKINKADYSGPGEYTTNNIYKLMVLLIELCDIASIGEIERIGNAITTTKARWLIDYNLRPNGLKDWYRGCYDRSYEFREKYASALAKLAKDHEWS